MLRGKEVSLRAIEREDLTQLLNWRNNPALRRYFREFRELNMDQQLSWFENTIISDERVRMFAIIENNDSKLIGASGLCYIDPVNRNADFSIYVGARDLYIDERLAPEAASLTIEYGFCELGLHRIWAEIYDFDIKKEKMFTQMGFSLEGRHRETHWTESGWHDSLFFGLLCKNWK